MKALELKFTAFLATLLVGGMTFAADATQPTTGQEPPAQPIAAKWACQPAPVQLPHGFDPNRIYLGARPTLLPDGSAFLFEWCDAIWYAPTAGGTA